MATLNNATRVRAIERAKGAVAGALPAIETETQRLGYLAKASQLLMDTEGRIDG